MEHQDVVDLAERVARGLALEAREPLEQLPAGGEHVPLRAQELLQAEELAAQAGDVAAHHVARPLEGLLLELVDARGLALDELGQRVGQGVEDPEDEVDLAADVALRDRPARADELVAGVAADRHDVLAAEVEVDLDGLVVAVGAVEDEQHLAAVVVELRALAELLGVLEGQRRQLEDGAEQVQLGLRGSQEVEPEELAALPERAHAVDVDVVEDLHPAPRKLAAAPDAPGSGARARRRPEPRCYAASASAAPSARAACSSSHALGLCPAGADVDEGPRQRGADERDQGAEAQAAVERGDEGVLDGAPDVPPLTRDAAGAEAVGELAAGGRRAPAAAARRASSGPGRR